MKDLYAHKIAFNINCTHLFRNINTVRCFIMNKIMLIVALTFISLLSVFVIKDITTYATTLIGTLFIDMVVLVWDIKGEINHTESDVSYQHGNA